MLSKLRALLCFSLLVLFTDSFFAQIAPPKSVAVYYKFNDINNSNNYQVLQTPCNNWLSLPSYQSYVSVGDLDVPGNTITVEAIFNRTAPYSNGYNWAGDLVSKHVDPVDVNYLLRPNNAEITTTNGYFTTPPICEIELNKVYHAAMVYDGSSLKFYRNGYLMSSVPASGNMFQNNHQTRIGLYDALTHNTNLIGYINEVRIWNVARTQAQIKSFMNTSLPTPTTQTGLLAYYTFDNLLNKQGNATWNGTLGGSAAINATNPSCTFTADTCALPPCTQKNDFFFTQNACAPYQFSFATTSTNYESITWDFGDGNSATGTATVSHTYTAQGYYKVLMIQKYLNCVDTVQKTFNISIQNDNQTILTPDSTICFGVTKQLRSAPALTYCWSPVTHLDNPSAQNPVSSSPGNITYYLTSEKRGANLVVNGNFSAGNTGFTSDYFYSPSSGFNPGVYTVGNNPLAWHPQMPPCPDHTGSAGNMMLVNGAEILNVKVWTQTVAVQPNTNYAFETWLQHITSVNPAILQFSINGVTIGPIFTANNSSCIWDKFYATWNSGNNTSATISIVNQNQIYTGNDFALDDISFTPIIITRDSVKITVENCATVNCSQKNDFSFTQNACAPYQFSFATTSTTYESITWDFGDGNSASGSSTVSHTYAAPGNYEISMIQKYQNCIDTVQKTFSISIQNDNQTILTPDTTICFGSTKQLRSAPALTYCWSPATHLDNPSIQNPVSSSPRNITYYLTSEKKGNNLIINGNFSNGNTDFTSAYNYASSNITEGQYFVGASPQAWNPSLSNCGDHTTENGNMMLVNGSPAPNVKVWTQTVTVVPNTNYSFSTWIQALWAPNPAQLQFSINNNDIGSIITASLPTCTWTQFYTTWNSGNATSATISIINKNTQVLGNDFALDDISFTPIIITRDSVKITVDSPIINTGADSAICSGSSMQINTSGALNYVWLPSNGLSNPQIANPVANPTSTTKYIVTGTNSFGCTGRDSVIVTVKPIPIVSISNDTLICSGSSIQLNAMGGLSYNWSPTNSLSNAAISNPVATPSLTTSYKVIVSNADNCSSIDSVLVKVRQPNTFTANSSSAVCVGDSVQLVASGGDVYLWSPAYSLSSINAPNPFAYPTSTTAYDVTISDTLCNISETLTTTVTINPLPVLQTSKSNDVDCSTSTSQLNVTGAVQYAWMPSGTLNNPFIPNPTASPLATTSYIVTAKDINGCSNTDSITVLVTANNPGNYLMPNAFTPNNDGINDFFGIYNWGLVTQLEFSIYNRWGQRVFYTTDPNNCWNGKYKAESQIPGVYAYVINAKNTCGVIKRSGIVTLVR